MSVAPLASDPAQGQTATPAVEQAPIPDVLRYQVPPASRNKIAVTSGQRIVRGQTIVSASTSGAASMHAGSSGVVAVRGDAQTGICIEVSTDGCDTSCKDTALGDNFRDMSGPELGQYFHSNGLVGLGGGCFPVAHKLAALDRHRARVLLINAVECDPAISCDQAVILDNAQAVIRGVEIAAHACEAEQVIIAVKAGAKAVHSRLQHALQAQPIANASLKVVANTYPAGYERQLFALATGHSIAPATHPTQSGLISFNISTCVAMARLIDDAEPLYSRICTVQEPARAVVRNVEVRLGTPYRDLFTQPGTHLHRLARSGVIRESKAMDVDAAITPASNCVILNPAAATMTACIRCGLCADTCPESLQPQQLLHYARSLQTDQLARHQLDRCIECGCCDLACPSHIPLTRLFQQTKTSLDRQAEQIRLASNAKARFKRRQQRHDRQREENRKKLERKQAQIAQRANQDSASADPRKQMLESALRRRAKKRPPGNPDTPS